MSNFSEKFSSYSITELLIIVKNKNDYQVDALKAAQRELDRRKISDFDLRLAQERLKSIQENDPVDFYDKIDSFLEIFKVKNNHNSKIVLKRIHLLLLGLFIFFIYRARLYFELIFTGYQNLTSLDIFFFIELFMLPFIAFLLFKKKQYVWQFSFFYLVLRFIYMLLNKIQFAIYLFQTEDERFELAYFYSDFIVLVFYILLVYFFMNTVFKKSYYQ